MPQPDDSFVPDYIVVGSGAGGGTVAARLAESGASVVVLEAGGDLLDPASADLPGLPEDYAVPAFHTQASENEAMKWDFFVRHYAGEQQLRDDKYRTTANGRPVDGVLYPRSGTLGGCTAHNAMIAVYPHNADFDAIAALTGDESWRAEAMRGWFEKLEDCRHRPVQRGLAELGVNPTRHGFGGWLPTEQALPLTAFTDKNLLHTLTASVARAVATDPNKAVDLAELAEGLGDPNDWSLVQRDAEGLRYTPLATRNHGRMGTRERLMEVKAAFPGTLDIRLHCLATRIVFDDANRAVGVDYLQGEKLYRAHGQPSPAGGTARHLRCRREVILAGGAFNTPQLLMLSGIGPADHLAEHGIAVRVPLNGVGRNLQDRYEVGVTNRMAFDAWEVLKGATFTRDDPLYAQWKDRRDGVYTTNGAVLAVVKTSLPERALPDLFCFALLGDFSGYYPGYSAIFAKHLNYMTWAILKAHTENRGGTVRLRSADPRDTPLIDFHYFEEGTDKDGADLASVVAALKFVRQLTRPLKDQGLIAAEEVPGEAVQSDAELAQFVRDNAWGHHASCTCAIGPVVSGGVLGSDFAVHGTQGLRVVDASVFPRIPGFFIVTAIYMIAEKAADAILRDAA